MDEQVKGTDEQVEGTDEHIEGTEEHNEGAEEQREGTEEKVESTDGQRKDRHLAEKASSRTMKESNLQRRTSKSSLHDDNWRSQKIACTTENHKLSGKTTTKESTQKSNDDLLKAYEMLIKKMMRKDVVFNLREVIKEESKEEVQEESKEEESTRKRKLGTRKKMKSRKRRYIQNTSEDDSDKENDELRLHLTIAPDEEKEVDYEILDRKYPIKEWKTECLGTKPQTDQAEHIEEINQNVVIRSNGQKRYFSTLMRVQYLVTETGLVIHEFEDGIVIHMLVERRYPLSKDLLQRMLDLGLEVERESSVALDLIRHKNWLVHKQTACGKDFSNPFMVDNLPKIVGFSTHLASLVKSWLVQDQTVLALASPKANELTIPEQTATGKGTSNPFMAGSLPKTTKPT
ncbi:hypothetical protein Tco_0152850 [Tanacetum coccineum]